MKNILTGIGDDFLNNKLRENENYNVLLKDILYDDGIIDFINEEKNIDIIFFSTNILYKYSLNNFIEKILEKNNIKLIIFYNEKNNIDFSFLNSKKIYKIYKNNLDGYLNCINELNIKNKNNLLKNNIEELKNEIINNPKNNKKIKKKNIKENKIINNKRNNIYLFSGVSGSGKSIILFLFAKYLEKNNYKILIVDINSENPSLNVLFNKEIKNNLIKINKKIDLLNLNNLENNYYEKNKLLNNLIINYDYILCDSNFDSKNNLLKLIMEKCKKIIFLFSPNLIEMQKAKNNLEIINYDLKINIKKINIFLNKINKNFLGTKIVKQIFFDYKISGKIFYNENFEKIINNFEMSKEIEKNIKNSLGKILND